MTFEEVSTAVVDVGGLVCFLGLAVIGFGISYAFWRAPGSEGVYGWLRGLFVGTMALAAALVWLAVMF